ncbi:MAG: VIT1/CCC1 transporter family protein, partial [Gemmatimonadota bacterium]|nr:VIT1/CCC1 transporter family protein [Gemmatimonadota bacterium]
EVERDELALIYEAKGMAPDVARARAAELMKDPERMLAEKVQEELKIGGHEQSPLREGWVTGLATAVGALIPVAPFFVLTGAAAIWTSFTASMASHFLVGAGRSVFTGRSVFRSGIDMFAVGLGVAVVGYFAGEWVAKLIG